MIEKKDWYWFHYPAHFIGGRDCQFRMATKVGEWIVSTVGEYEPFTKYYNDNGEMLVDAFKDKPDLFKPGPQEIGVDRFYETMVFKAKPAQCECCDW